MTGEPSAALSARPWERYQSPGDHPYTDPGDGRTECQTCGKWVWSFTHSCKGVPVTEAAWLRAHAKASEGPDIGGKPYHGWSCECADCEGYDEAGKPRPGEQAAARTIPDTPRDDYFG